MKHPQTTANELSENIKSIAKYGCLAMCYIYCAGIDEDNEIEYLRIVYNGIRNGILDKDCTVKDAEKFLFWITGRKVTVSKNNVQDISEIKNIAPVRFVAEGYGGHWVVVQNGKIVFNPLTDSVNVNKGKPVETRTIKWGIEK